MTINPCRKGNLRPELGKSTKGEWKNGEGAFTFRDIGSECSVGDSMQVNKKRPIAVDIASIAKEHRRPLQCRYKNEQRPKASSIFE